MAQQRFRDSDPVEEILNIALENQGGGPDMAMRQRLLTSAAELGISEDAALAAQKQWLEQRKQLAEQQEYRAHVTRSLYTHLGIYAVVNVFLVLMNMLTDHGKIDWAVWPLLGWGIGVGVHLVAALVQLKNPGGDEFEQWRKERGTSKGITIGVHISPKSNDETFGRS